MSPAGPVSPLLRALAWLAAHRAAVVAALVAFTLVRGALWAALIPPLDAPDEPSHLLAVAQIRAYHTLPVAILLDPNTLSTNSTPRPPAFLAYYAQPRFHYTHFRALSYESTSPPLYYLVCALLTAPLPADPPALLYGCRLVSALLGALTVFAAARAAAALAPDRPALTLGVPLVLVLWPQFAFQTATVSNDIALDLAGATLAWGWAAAMRTPSARGALLLGPLTGLGLLAKLTVVVTLPATGLILLGRARAGRRPPRQFLGEALLAGAAAAVLAGPWFVRNLRVYGEPTGQAQMFAVVQGTYLARLHLPPGTPFIVPPLGDFVWYSFATARGVFGWRGVFLPAPFYWLAGALTVLGAAGTLAWLRRRRRAGGAPLPPAQRWALAAFAATALPVWPAYALYTVTSDQSYQARHVFVARVPFATILAGGALHATRAPAANRVLAAAGLLGLAVLQAGAWLVIGRP